MFNKIYQNKEPVGLKIVNIVHHRNILLSLLLEQTVGWGGK